MEEKPRAARNRTLTLSAEEREALRAGIVDAGQFRQDGNPAGKVIQADLLDILPLLPDAFADLIIIDPPYNLTKDFNGLKFNHAARARAAADHTEPHHLAAGEGAGGEGQLEEFDGGHLVCRQKSEGLLL